MVSDSPNYQPTVVGVEVRYAFTFVHGNLQSALLKADSLRVDIEVGEVRFGEEPTTALWNRRVPAKANQGRWWIQQQYDWFATLQVFRLNIYCTARQRAPITSFPALAFIFPNYIKHDDRLWQEGLMAYYCISPVGARRWIIIQLFHFPRLPLWLHEVPDFVAVDCGSALKMKLHFWVLAFRMHNTRANCTPRVSVGRMDGRIRGREVTEATESRIFWCEKVSRESSAHRQTCRSQRA